MRVFCFLIFFVMVGSGSAFAGAEKSGDSFIESAVAKHGEFGRRAARFLVENMPPADAEELSDAYLLENLQLAIEARNRFPWGRQVPEELFFNDVLPYAVFDESRDPWRAKLHSLAGGLVKDAATASEAAQILNRDLFDKIATHYDRGRARANQSPEESIRQGKASCTGLSILLVCACRSVGIPARAVGTPMWWNESGNHTWVEIWDGEWKFAGADEYDPKGLNRGWFVKNAARAVEGDPRKAIYATSWKRGTGHFPLVWAPKSRSVAAVNVTGRYQVDSGDGKSSVGVRLLDGDKRLAIQGWLTKPSGFPVCGFETKAGTADYNDTARVPVEAGAAYRWRFLVDGGARETEVFVVKEGGGDIRDIALDELKPAADFSDPESPLTAEQAKRAIRFIHDEMVAGSAESMKKELEEKEVTFGDHRMRWLEKTFGEAPAGKRSLWISMHGGGGAPKQVNDQQWQNQIRLYQPEEGIYVAPRAPTDTWNLWHQGHIDPLFSRLIEAMVAFRGVDPNRVYLMGYSAGGDGVWQLAPRMADRFAAAAMMAGHPNESQLFGLRNLPFAIYMGGEDHAHNRAKVAREKSQELAQLHQQDPGGYVHRTKIYEGMGHWMDRKDAEALPWMAKFSRNPWPEKLVWYQDDVTHDRFYWLRVPAGKAEKGHKVVATRQGRTFSIEGDLPEGAELVLSDELLDLDEPIEIQVNGGGRRKVQPVRTLATIREALRDRLDPASAYTAKVPCP